MQPNKRRAYGMPYLGSKNHIARWVIENLPPAKHFYDVFAGGCAVAHAALLSGKYEVVHINDINPMPIECFLKALRGGYERENRVIDRDTFFKLRYKDPYASYCWSFGNNGGSYVWGHNLEQAKILASHMLMADTLEERYSYYLKYVNEINKHPNTYGRSHALKPIENLKRLKSIRALDNQVVATTSDYESVGLEPDSVIYCDIPYKDTDTRRYRTRFDYERFYDWAQRQKNIFISEQSMPESRFEIVAECVKVRTFDNNGSRPKAIERIYKPTTICER